MIEMISRRGAGKKRTLPYPLTVWLRLQKFQFDPTDASTHCVMERRLVLRAANGTVS